jgi:hypothetical protein
MQAKQFSLDGRRFDGIVLERGKTADDADTILFANGRFRSSACDPYGYGDGPYTASSSADGIVFEAQTQNANGSRLLWRGVVRGPRLDGTLTLLRDGSTVGEKWVLAGEC